MFKQYRLKELQAMRRTKDQMFKDLDVSFDTALPQIASTSGQGETTIVRNGRSEETIKHAYAIRKTV